MNQSVHSDNINSIWNMMEIGSAPSTQGVEESGEYDMDISLDCEGENLMLVQENKQLKQKIQGLQYLLSQANAEKFILGEQIGNLVQTVATQQQEINEKTQEIANMPRKLNEMREKLEDTKKASEMQRIEMKNIKRQESAKIVDLIIKIGQIETLNKEVCDLFKYILLLKSKPTNSAVTHEDGNLFGIFEKPETSEMKQKCIKCTECHKTFHSQEENLQDDSTIPQSPRLQ